MGQANALLHPFRVGFERAAAGGFEFDEFEDLVDPMFQLGAPEAEDSAIETKDFFGGQEFVVVGLLGKKSDPFSRDWLPNVNPEYFRSTAGGGDESKQ